MKKLGDDYLRNEFKLHKQAKAEQTEKFFRAWDEYLNILKRSERDGRIGHDMHDRVKVNLSEEQKKKLNDLKAEATKIAQEK
jgi:hypothetical protein